MAYLLSWHPQFGNCREDLVRTTLPYLRSSDDRQVAATLQFLNSAVRSVKATRPANSEVSIEADRAVLAVAPNLVKRGGDIPQALALYLGGIKTDVSRGLLWQLADRTGTGHEQALIVLTWIADDRDLPILGDMLLKPGVSDFYGRDLAVLPYHILHGYGDRAIPYLEQAIAKSPYAFVQTSSAEQLVLIGRPTALNFFLDSVQNNRFYKPELVQWLKDYCGLTQTADDAAAITFLNQRLAR
jgi:hypothetical protein